MPTQTFPTEIYNFVDVFVPVLAIGIGIAIALFLLVKIGEAVMQILYPGLIEKSPPLEFDKDMLIRSIEAHLGELHLAEKQKNDDKPKNDDLVWHDSIDPEPDYVSFEALLADKPKRKLKNDDL